MYLRQSRVRVIAPLALMGLIFYLSAQPAVGPDLAEWTRVVAHFTQYAALAALWAWALAPSLGVARALVGSALICALYAVSDEIHQSFVEGRDSDPLDVVTDWAGITVALALARGR